MMNVTTMMKLVLAPVKPLEKFHSYWSSIWQRVDDPETFTMQEYMQQIQVQPKPQREWEPVAAPLFYQCAIKQKGKAGSIDGWSGSEVSIWPFDMWESITPTHLPKQGRQRQWDGATPVSKLAAVAVTSVWRRISIGAWCQSHPAQEWYQGQLATQQHGSRRKRDVIRSLDSLAEFSRSSRKQSIHGES